VDLALRTLFESPTLAELAREIEAAGRQAGEAAPPLVALPRTGCAVPRQKHFTDNNARCQGISRTLDIVHHRLFTI